MKITQLYTYPIKSLRSVPLTHTTLTPHGLPHDRRFLLLRVHNPAAPPVKPRSKSHFDASNGLENMTITYYPELSLFLQSINEAESILTVRNTEKGKEKSLDIPLNADVGRMEEIEVVMHSSPTKAYLMEERVNEWFSSCLGYEVVLAYLGPHRRKVLGNLAPGGGGAAAANGTSTQSWLGNMARGLPSIMGFGGKEEEEVITFADVAAYLVVTEESLEEVSERLPQGVEMDVTKFRPNIVLEGADQAWEEDYWGGVTIKGERDSEIVLTSNCARCVSINVDYETGKSGQGEENVLKKLMGDRRVDRGTKWSPIFGRYGFLRSGSGLEKETPVSVGDEVVVSRRNEERTTFGESVEIQSAWQRMKKVGDGNFQFANN